jgi:hypothetical protein
VSLPEGQREFLILHYIDKAGELESESWKSLRDGQAISVKQFVPAWRA